VWFRRKRRLEDFSKEVQSHIELEADQLVREGMTPEKARSAAIRRFGNPGVAEERFYELGRVLWLDHLGQDLRYALRGLRRNPGFALVAVLTLAIGIGANTAIFSFVDPLFFEKLPVPRPEELISLNPVRPDLRILMPMLPEAAGKSGSRKITGGGLTYREYERLRNQNDVLEGLLVFGGRDNGLRLQDADESLKIEGRALVAEKVSRGYFRTLGIPPVVGRDFGEEDYAAAAMPVGIISHALWQQRLDSDPNVIGRRLTFASPSRHPEDDDLRFTITVVGVAQPGFSGVYVGSPNDIWVPFQGTAGEETPKDLSWWNGHFAIARLRPGVRLDHAQATLNALFERAQAEWAAEFGESWTQNQRDQFGGQQLRLESFATGSADLRLQFKEQFSVLMAAVGSVLVIACINVAVLLLARGGARRKEFAIRLSIGGGRFRLVRQLLIESLTLAFLAAILGVGIAHWGAKLLLVYTPELAALDIGPDPRVLAFTLMTAVASALLFGLIPAFRSTRPDVAPALKEVRIAASRATSRFSLDKLLIASQIALSLVLLVGAGLFVRTLWNQNNVDTGFDRETVLVFNMSRAVELSRLEQLFRRVEGFPGVESATTWDTGLLGQGIMLVGPVQVDGFVAQPGEDLWMFATHVSSRFFETAGVSIIAGRNFQPQDSGRRVAVINQTMAKYFFGDESPIGKHYNVTLDPEKKTEIIGVSEDTKYESLTTVAPRITYFPFPMNGEQARSSKFAIRISSPPSSLSNAVVSAVKELDGQLQVTGIHTLEDSVQQQLARQRFVAHLAGFFSVLALLLACVGLYGTLSNAVTRRTNEIGIRLALGARAETVIRMLMRETGRVVAAGLLTGLAGAFVATRAVSSMLFGLSPTDPSTFVFAGILLVAAAATASYIPARRASRVDPVVALRHD
jgi:predicted permease